MQKCLFLRVILFENKSVFEKLKFCSLPSAEIYCKILHILI